MTPAEECTYRCEVSCPAYANFQPPYEECTCGAEKRRTEAQVARLKWERTYEREVWRRELRRIERAQSLESVVRGHVSTREAYTHRKLAELESRDMGEQS